MVTLRVGHDVEIRRPLADVFAFVSDREHLPAWNVGVQKARRTSPPGPIGVGTTYVVVGRVLGRRVESTYEVTAFEPDRLVAGRMTSPLFSVEEKYHFEPRGDGAHIQLEVTARPEKVLRLLGPLLGPALTRQVRTDHEKLKAVLEKTPKRDAAPEPPPPPPDDRPLRT